jgi:hypothetical protein
MKKKKKQKKNKKKNKRISNSLFLSLYLIFFSSSPALCLYLNVRQLKLIGFICNIFNYLNEENKRFTNYLSLFFIREKYKKKPPKLQAVYNLAPQCSKSNKVAPQTTKM